MSKQTTTPQIFDAERVVELWIDGRSIVDIAAQHGIHSVSCESIIRQYVKLATRGRMHEPAEYEEEEH
ncbi:MAG: helix-turn-helix domain-containing protein [Planctomycetota bacterium]